MHILAPLEQLAVTRFESPAILKKVASASRHLAELKGVAAAIPNQGILINTLGMQEAKDSSAIENIVTTHDELFQDDAFPEAKVNPTAKEVLHYRQALINNLFTHPYTKIEYVMHDLKVSRLTATKYLDRLAADGILEKQKHGRSNYYINLALYPILTRQSLLEGAQ